MRKLGFIILCLCMALTAFGQSKLDLQSQMMLLQIRNTAIPTYNSRTRSFERPREVQQNVMAMVEFTGKNALDELDAQGAKVLRVRGDIAIVMVPIADVERIAELKCVRRLELSRPVYQKMDIVRKTIGIDKIHQGIDLPQAYTGKGVVTGIVDGGIDPNHINFLKPDGTTRFGYISKITATTTTQQGYLYQNYYPRAVLDTMKQQDNTYAIEDFATDSYTNFHGTHTRRVLWLVATRETSWLQRPMTRICLTMLQCPTFIMAVLLSRRLWLRVAICATSLLLLALMILSTILNCRVLSASLVS